MLTLIRSWPLAIALLLLIGVAHSAEAQCTGDCNGDGTVAINELITGVNIALGSTPVSSCPSFDVSGDGTVAINELIAAVNNALNGCPAVTPTQTATTSPTTSVTWQSHRRSVLNRRPPAVTLPDVLSKTETCDDGNTVDDDGCPSNRCGSAAHAEVAPRQRQLRHQQPGQKLIGLSLWIRYRMASLTSRTDDRRRSSPRSAPTSRRRPTRLQLRHEPGPR
jgi:cysteine-rich repeat protein